MPPGRSCWCSWASPSSPLVEPAGSVPGPDLLRRRRAPPDAPGGPRAAPPRSAGGGRGPPPELSPTTSSSGAGIARADAVPEVEIDRRAAPRPLDAGPPRGDGSTMGLIAEVKRSSPQGRAGQIPGPTRRHRRARRLRDQRPHRAAPLPRLPRGPDACARVDVPCCARTSSSSPTRCSRPRPRRRSVLLIVAALDDVQLRELHDSRPSSACRPSSRPTEDELERALALEADTASTPATCDLIVDLGAPPICWPDPRRPSRSANPPCLRRGRRVSAAGAVLVGEALVTSGDPAAEASSYRRVTRRGRPVSEGAQA